MGDLKAVVAAPPAWLWQGILLILAGLLVQWGIRRGCRARDDLRRQARELHDELGQLSAEVAGMAARIGEAEEDLSQRADTWRDEIAGLEERVRVLLDASSIETDLTFRGRLLWSERRYADANDVLSRAIESGNPPAQAFYYRGLCRMKLGRDQWSGAVSDFQVAASAERAQPDWLLALGQALIRLGRWREARGAAQGALDRGATDRSAAWTLVGWAEEGLRQHELALEAFRQCASTYPAAAEGIGRVLTQMADKATTEPGRSMAWGDVFRHYTEAISAAPRSSSLRVQRAAAYVHHDAEGEWGRAMADFSEAERISRGRDTSVFRERGDAWFDKGAASADLELARACFTEAAADYMKGARMSPPTYAPVFRTRLSGVYQRLNQKELALEQARLSVEGNPAYVRNRMCYVQCLLWNVRWGDARSEAEDLFRLAATHSPHSPSGVWAAFFAVAASLSMLDEQHVTHALVSRFTAERRALPEFDPSLWDWARVDEAVSVALAPNRSLARAWDLLKRLLVTRWPDRCEPAAFSEMERELLAAISPSEHQASPN